MLMANPANSIGDTTSWDKPRTLDNIPGFLEKFAGNSTKLWSASKKNGTPHTIIVTAAGLRAAETARYGCPKDLIMVLIRLEGWSESSRRRMQQLPNSLQNISKFKTR